MYDQNCHKEEIGGIDADNFLHDLHFDEFNRQIEPPKFCPKCGSEVELDPVSDYGVGGINYEGWLCLDNKEIGCDAGEIERVSTWRVLY